MPEADGYMTIRASASWHAQHKLEEHGNEHGKAGTEKPTHETKANTMDMTAQYHPTLTRPIFRGQHLQDSVAS